MLANITILKIHSPTKNMGTGKKLDCREIQYLLHIADALEEAGGRLDGWTLMKAVDKRMNDDKLEALEALADGDGHLIPYVQTVYPGSTVEIIICFDKNRKRICVPVDDAFSALASSGLSRSKLEEAVKGCRPDFNDELAELFRPLDEQEHLDSLIKVGEAGSDFSF